MQYKGNHQESGLLVDNSRTVDYGAVMRHAMSDRAYTLPEASLRLPFDEELFKKSKELAAKLAGPKLSYVIDIGIGGSNLGAKAVYDATAGVMDPHTPFAPKMIFADTCSPELISDIVELLVSEITEKEEFIIIVASKSGSTTETMVNASIIVRALEQKIGDIHDRIVCITDQGSPLWGTGEKEGYHLLPIPKMVGGRFSVFSPAGIFPLLCVGLDGDAFIKGAQQVVDETVAQGEESSAYKLARDMFLWGKAGTTIVDFFAFHPELESVGKWYRQLFAESIGKETTRDGKEATHRLVPTVSIGSTDLHSVEQMNLAHRGVMARLMIRAHEPHWEHEFLVEEKVFTPLVPSIARRAPCEIIDAIYEGVILVYKEKNVPHAEINLSRLDAESLGTLLQFLMCGVMHLGNLLNINTFDQPNVEEYKERTRTILSGK